MPDGVRHLVDLHYEVLLADATYQPNCGGYILLHATIVDDSGLYRPIFYALIPKELGASHCGAVNIIRNILSSTGNVKSIVVDQSLEQLNPSQAAYPEARVSFCRLHALLKMRSCCNGLPVSVEGKSERIPQ